MHARLALIGSLPLVHSAHRGVAGRPPPGTALHLVRRLHPFHRLVARAQRLGSPAVRVRAWLVLRAGVHEHERHRRPVRTRGAPGHRGGPSQLLPGAGQPHRHFGLGAGGRDGRSGGFLWGSRRRVWPGGAGSSADDGGAVTQATWRRLPCRVWLGRRWGSRRRHGWDRKGSPRLLTGSQ
eukprot:scaffold11043_cov111-Isochrysis_galbana.AAC.4